MNPNLTNVPASYPSTATPSSDVLFSTLGFFWHRMFKDSPAVKGLTMAQADSSIQDYYKLVELINSYSCYNIPIFETRRWYPLYIYRSSLDNNELLFGEGVTFGATLSAQPYTFGRSIPSSGTKVSMVVPEELQQASIIVDQIVTPNNTLVNGTDFTLNGRRLFFNTSPFNLANTRIQNVVNPDGTPSMFSYYDSSGTHFTIQDQLLILWCYNAGIDSDNLDYNLGYLFGLNVPHNENGKEILISVVQNFTQGCTISDIKSVGVTSLGLPIIKAEEQITNITGTVVTTANNVYSYPNTYSLKSGITVGSWIKPGDVLVQNAVELYDNVNTPNWWTNKLTANGQNLPLQMPKAMVMGSAKYNIGFVNTVGPISLNNITGLVSFGDGMLIGSAKDIAAFSAAVSTPAFINLVGLNISTTMMVNPVNLFFNTYLKTCTALLSINFLNTSQLANFVTYFSAISSTLPPTVLLIVLCDLTLPQDIMHVNAVLNDIATTSEGNGNLTNGLIMSTSTHFPSPVQKTNDIVHLNGSTGFMINDMAMSRVIIAPILSGDLRNVSLTRSS